MARSPFGAGSPEDDPLTFSFSGRLLYWRGPSPFFFVPVPDDVSAAIQAIAPAVTYGWGVIPVTVRIGRTEFETSLFPKDGRYLVPIKVAVRRAEQIPDEATVELVLSIRH
jgi:hypothetical protein